MVNGSLSSGTDLKKLFCMISWADFEKIEIRSGTILEVTDFPKAKKPAYQLKIDFGGGIKKEATLKTVLDTGATYATIGSLAVKSRNVFEEWIARFGAEVFMLGADVFEEKIVEGRYGA